MKIATKVIFDPDTFKAIPVEWYEYDGPVDWMRGAASAAKTQLGTTNAIGAEQQKKADTLQNQLVPGYTSLMDTGYLSPDEEAAATQTEMGAASAPFETAKFGAANRAGATRNASDLTAQQDQLALEEGQTAAGAAATLQNQKMTNQQAGMYGLGQEQNLDVNEASTMYGLGPSTINAWSNAQNNNPMLNFAGKLIGAAGTAAGG